MAGKSTISITFKLDGDGKGFKELAKDADGLKTIMTSTLSEAKKLSTGAINFAALASGIDAAQRSFNQLLSGMKELAGAYAIQETAEKQLETVMAQRMNASAADIQAIKDLASAQQELGVIGDEVQLSGAQQVATFLNEKKSLETLLPAMNDLLAQQKGLNATNQDAVTVGNLMGKVMQGQTSALTRVGITFDEAEEKVLKYGTESERAAMLAQVITNNVGQMNAALASTDSGQQKQLDNTLGDVKEKIGGLVNGALPFVTISAQALTAVGSVITLSAGIKTLTTTLYTGAKAFAMATASMIKNKVAAVAVAAAQKAVSAATVIWTGVQKILNLVLTMNPIGLIIMAIGALVAGVIYAYNNFEGFRNICDKVWGVIKTLAGAIMNGLTKAFEWLVEKCKQAWEWLKKILGLGGKKAEVTIDVKTTTSGKTAPTIDLEGTKDKYKNYTDKEPKAPKTPKAPKDNTPIWKEDATTLKDITANIQVLTNKLQTASVAEAALINQQIDGWNKKADAISNAGKAAENNDPLWKEDATTLRDITDNIQILTDKLQTASVEEAAQINLQIEAWNKKADAISNAGKAAENNAKAWSDSAGNLKEIGDNLQILNDRLQIASASEAAAINNEIELWNKKADAIRNAGKAAEESGLKTGEALTKSWGGIKQIGSSVEGITSALQGNGNAWQIVVGIVDGFLGLYQGIQTVVGIINLLTAASAAHAVTKGVEAGAETAAAGATGGAATANAISGTATIATNKLVAASWKELAAAEYMAAHAYIPFAGFGIAMGFTTAMLAVTAAAGIPMLADGGIASGPTLAMVGEYAGASGNPEVIAPLDKLRGMLSDTAGGGVGGKVEFEIKGRNLVGILNKENNIIKRS